MSRTSLKIVSRSLDLFLLALPMLMLFLSPLAGALPEELNSTDSLANLGSVVICQVELNPPGDDLDREWVKLLNPGDGEVKMGCWTISSSCGGALQKILPETVIPSGGYCTLKYEVPWLNDRNETILLKDETGAIVDFTPELNDTGNDNCIWSRLFCEGEVDSWSYVNLYIQIDRHALAAPAKAEESLESLASYLADSFENDDEKVRAIFRWVAENIDYDVDEYLKGSGYKSAEDVLKDRKAVCSGYSALFCRLCEAADIECVEVEGYGKGHSYRAGSPVSGPSNHAWNVVKVEGSWQLIDPTWGAGYLSGTSFVRKFEDYYFLTPPEELVYTHYPRDQKWQLLETPVSKEEFERFPYLKPSFFKNGIKTKSHSLVVIEAEDGVNVTLCAPEDVRFTANLELEGEKVPDRFVFVQGVAGEYDVRAHFPEKGEYVLRIYSKRKGDPGVYEESLVYRVDAASGLGDLIGFPKAYGTFYELGARLYTPLEGRLEAGKPHKFQLAVPGAEDVVALNGEKWTHLAKNEDIFEGEFALERGDVKISVKFPDEYLYHVLLEYKVF